MSKNTHDHIDLDNFWPYQAIVLSDKISRHTLGVVKKDAGLNLSQWRVLAAVAEKPGRTAADVTAMTPMDKTIVSRAVSSLLAAGLIKKTPHPSDKRRATLRPSAQGNRIYKRIAAKLNQDMISNFKANASAHKLIAILKDYSAKMDMIALSKDS